MMAAAECLTGNADSSNADSSNADSSNADSSNARLHLRRLVLVAPVNPYSAHGRRLAPFFGSKFGTALVPVDERAYALFSIPIGMRACMATAAGFRRERLEGYMAPLAKPGLFEHALSIVRTWTEDLRELEATLPRLAGIPTLADVGQQGFRRCMLRRLCRWRSALRIPS